MTLTRASRLVPRLRPGLPPAPPPAGPALLRVGQPGQLGSLHWAPLALPAPGPGEVLLRVEAAGVNFRDLMWAQGLLPEEALLPGFAGPGLGMECAGVVEAVGEATPSVPATASSALRRGRWRPRRSPGPRRWPGCPTASTPPPPPPSRLPS
ncbi:alcohol dehydrogenase catalytic domain-containing protein [Dankookia sp. P2]|uniref:alcohol dehydrogenase catalytic domain-containing protein n=1 Tax=Dankookia sp. P2 TaxID=3423955 RepID=UPI003D67B68E